MIRNIKNKILNFYSIRKYSIVVGENFTCYGKIFFHTTKKKIFIGNNCVIRSSIYTNTLGGMKECRFVTYNDGKIFIGNNVGITNTCINAHSTITIEDNVNIGGDCKIYDSDFHSIEYNKRIKANDNEYVSKPIVIKEGAWIGAHSIILKGVTIGKRSVIGAGSVVTCDIPNDEVWGGNPARFIKKINN